MDTKQMAELTMVLRQISGIIDHLEELGEQEREGLATLPKRSSERSRSQNLCDGIDDAIDSLTDAIHCLEEGMDPEA